MPKFLKTETQRHNFRRVANTTEAVHTNNFLCTTLNLWRRNYFL